MLIAAEDLDLRPIAALQDIHGIAFPAFARFRQFLITGPPGAGKSTLVRKMRGWPYEGYLNLALPGWWKVRDLTFRPREIHLGVPFRGVDEALTVLDDVWLAGFDTLDMDFRRIEIPPTKAWMLGVDWRARYVFEFILPPVDEVLHDRQERARSGLFPYDQHLSHDVVAAQIAFYRTIAWYFWASGISVYIRTTREGPPMEIINCRNVPSL